MKLRIYRHDCVIVAFITVLVMGTVAHSDSLDEAFDRQRNANAPQHIYEQGVPHTDKNGRELDHYDPERSFFPIGTWGAPMHGERWGHTYDWRFLEEAGYNTVWPWPVPRDYDRMLRDADAHNLQVIVIQPISRDDLTRIKDHPRLLGNAWHDEPINKLTTGKMQEMHDEFMAYKKTTNEIAPNMRVFVNDSPWIMEPATIWWAKWNSTGDVSCHDTYPFMDHRKRASSIGAEPNGVPQTISFAVSVNHEQKPVWHIVGTFDQLAPPLFPFPFRHPTAEQLRSHVYAALIHGATGIHYFAWDSYVTRTSGVVGMSPDPQVAYVPIPEQPGYPKASPATPMQMIRARMLWDAAKQINSEIEAITPAIFSSTVSIAECDYKVKIEGKSVTAAPIRALLKHHPDGGYVLMTVNLDDAVLQVEYTFPQPLKEVARMFENQAPLTLGDEASVFSEQYEPFETHVYRIFPQSDK